MPQPNILFVFADQLSARWLPVDGCAAVRAPHLDRFAACSTVFTRAYTNVPLCTPYRACLLTGRYPRETGVTDNGMALPSTVPTLAECLNSSGYSTHYVGKWHLSGKPQCNRWVPPARRGGFQRFFGWESHHVDHWRGRAWGDDARRARPLHGHETDGLTDVVCAALRRLSEVDSPFFMVVSYQAPHAPCSPPEAFGKLYPDPDLSDPPSTDPEAWFVHGPWRADYGVSEFRRRYFGEISQLDAAFGRVLDTLAETGLTNRTVVVFTSDHGEMAGCHGLFGKGVMYDEAVRVPLIVHRPGCRGCQLAAPVSTVDLMPTLLALCGAPAPPDLPGRNLTGLLDGNGSGGADAGDVFIQHNRDCIIRGDWKLVAARDEDQPVELYNLAVDPYELHNLVGDSEGMRAVPAADMMAALAAWRRRTRRLPGT